MGKTEIKSDKAPAAIGPYSQGLRAGSLLFLSGSIPVDPATGEVDTGGIEQQTHRVLMNIEAVLNEAGAGLTSVVKTTVFLKDMGDFPAMNEVYGEFFSRPYPARSTVGVKDLPKGVSVEIDAVAVIDSD
ncbi:MAG: RidA family protein [Thermodesulfobacteriota bacterium]